MTTAETRFVVTAVGIMQQLEGAAIDLERTLRQYAIIQNTTVADLTDNAIAQFASARQDLCDIIDNSENCQQLVKQIEQLRNFRTINDQLLLNAYLASLSNGVIAMAIQREDMTSMQAKQAWSTAMLVSVSLLLILLGSQLIVKPVNKLKQIIQILAHQRGELPPLSTKAPFELIGVEKDLHWLSERLQQLEHIRTALLRHAAHELKTPLASIKEGCSLLSENVVGELNPQQAEVLSLLSSSTQRLNTLVEKLLDYNLLLQQAEPKFTSIDPAELVRDCVEDYALALQDREVTVDVRVESVSIDEELYRRILDNLVSNAVAHGAIGRPISVNIYEQDGVAVLDVANRGKKIPPEKVGKLFEPFTRGDDPRNDNVIGTGLGLSIVSDCARLMCGDVAVVEVDYADVCFRVSIPQKEKRK